MTEPTPAARGAELREQIAREAALHGLGRIDGLGDRSPPNEKWTQGEWERRILECVPSAVEAQCYALADAILALLPTTPPAEPSPDVLGEIRKALEPFAEAAVHLHPSQPDDGVTLDGIEVRHWRRAAEALRLLDALAVQQADGGGRGG